MGAFGLCAAEIGDRVLKGFGLTVSLSAASEALSAPRDRGEALSNSSSDRTLGSIGPPGRT